MDRSVQFNLQRDYERRIRLGGLNALLAPYNHPARIPASSSRYVVKFPVQGSVQREAS